MPYKVNTECQWISNKLITLEITKYRQSFTSEIREDAKVLSSVDLFGYSTREEYANISADYIACVNHKFGIKNKDSLLL